MSEERKHYHVGVKFDPRQISYDYVITTHSEERAREIADEEREDGAREATVWPCGMAPCMFGRAVRG